MSNSVSCSLWMHIWCSDCTSMIRFCTSCQVRLSSSLYRERRLFLETELMDRDLLVTYILDLKRSIVEQLNVVVLDKVVGSAEGAQD